MEISSLFLFQDSAVLRLMWASWTVSLLLCRNSMAYSVTVHAVVAVLEPQARVISHFVNKYLSLFLIIHVNRFKRC